METNLLISMMFLPFHYCQGLNFQINFIFVTINEEKQPGSFVARARADPDPVRYELSADAGNLFAIDNTTGIITIERRFDREAENYTQDTFMVYAFDDAGNKASAQVWFWIQDINDNSPRFPSQHYNITVKETCDVDQQIFSATALDDDFGENAEILYEIADGNEDGMFKIKDAYHCDVLLVKALDFELRSSYKLNITASNYHESFSNWTILSITVGDEDDLPAKFSSFEYRGFVREDRSVGTSIIQVTAADQDKLNDPVTYKMVESTNNHSLFVINVSTGVISLNGTLDREDVSEYKLRVLAYSTYHLPDHATIDIQIGDANDNLPVFSAKHYSFSIQENAGIGAIVGEVKASDADQGINAAFSYVSPNDGTPFAFVANTGVLVVNGSLNREKQDRYTFLVFVKEFQTVEKYSSNTTVIVTVEDRNDNSPRFLKPFYEIAIQEELPSGTNVLQILANDSDSSFNALIVYSLVPDLNYHYLDFVINPINGSITTTKPLDRENISIYYLTVTAENSALNTQTRSSTVPVKINVEDINDNFPLFGQAFYTVTVTDSAAVNTTFLTVQATDKDLDKNAAIEYLFLKGNSGTVFSIDQESGSLSVAKELDREKVEVYHLIVQAKDGGNKSTAVNVTVLVGDVNDNSPQFTSLDGHQFSVIEETSGLTVGNIKANDSDIGRNAQIIYSLMNTPSSKSFRINSSTGEIFTSKALDYEVSRSHILVVQAEDQGLPQSRRTAVQVSINVIDINDNAPKFFNVQPDVKELKNLLACIAYNTTESTVFRVQDLTPANTEIGRVTAFDRDSSVNSKISYHIEGNGSKVFSIENHTGIIYAKQQLKRVENQIYNLTIIAENSLASPKLWSTMKVQVIVYGLSRKTPQFTASEYHAEISEAATVGTPVIQINITNNVQATAYFVFKVLHDQSSAGSRKFTIEPERGLITTQGELDREITANYSLMVEAKLLNPDPVLQVVSSAVPVFINISDEDDNKPRFLQRSYRFSSGELSRVGDLVGQVKAVDIDGEHQSDVFYEIASGNEKGLFNISEYHGTVYVKQGLGNEAASSVQLLIRALNSPVGLGNRKRRDGAVAFDEVSATIEIQDENNNPPAFIQSQFIGGFYEGEATRNTNVVTIQASDKDFGAYGSVRYSIVHEETPGLFLLDNTTGDVVLSNLSDQVTGKLLYVLTVSAVDNQGKVPSNRANENASVLIFVLSDSKKLSLELGVPSVFVREKRSEIKSMLRNLTGGTVMMKNITGTEDGSTLIYFHAIDNHSLSLLTRDEFMSRLRNKTDLINDVFRKWNIRVPLVGTADASRDSREEFSILIAVMLLLSGCIGVGAIISILIARKKRKRQKRAYKTTGESPYPLTTPWYLMDMPGTGVFSESKADGTRRPLDNTKYTVQKVPTNQGEFSLLRTPLRSSGSYKVRNQQRKRFKEQRRGAVSLNHYEFAPNHHSNSSEIDGSHDVVDNFARDTSTIVENMASHGNEGFDRSQGHERSEEKPMERQMVCELGEDTPCQLRRATNTVRRVRFDLRGTEDRKGEKRTARKNFPDIVVISEEADGSYQLDEHEMKRFCDNEEANDEDDKGKNPIDVGSMFENTRRSASVAAINDDEGTVVEI
ncbi:protocadherin Fat 4-like isoform X2 [Stylophora pistillata]|uniref:protocadherin Fat 4-like isoform X2 n=1 Tax=Stylophora pistillata TaxID=50429 RepID=UPI000C03FAE3|nr:protocadherin Fat 4-like isoform X2 [Stylophora pistillata]